VVSGPLGRRQEPHIHTDGRRAESRASIFKEVSAWKEGRLEYSTPLSATLFSVNRYSQKRIVWQTMAWQTSRTEVVFEGQ